VREAIDDHEDEQGNSRILPCSSSFLCLPVRKTIDDDNEDEDDNGKRAKRSTNCTVTGLLIFQSWRGKGLAGVATQISSLIGGSRRV
jgi:hypothetical protein